MKKMEKISEKIVHQKKMNEFIDLIEKIEEAGIKEYISLPSFNIIGTIYCGKGSVVENILNLDFLPHVDAKRPIVIKINHIKDDNQTYATLEESNSLQKYYDFSQLKKELLNILGNFKYSFELETVRGPLNINIYSPNLPSITIIDLPPIIKKNFFYDYFDKTEEEYKSIVYSYINNESTIIMCVIPANSYYQANIELRMAKAIDFGGKRTLGIVTKIDIMDLREDCRKLLLNQEIPLNFGYVGILNRSLSELINKKPIEEKYEEEKLFFNNDENYNRVPSHLLGHASIIDKMKKIYFMMVKKKIIDIFEELQRNKNIENIDEIIDSIKENDEINEFIKIFKENKKIIDDNKHLINVN